MKMCKKKNHQIKRHQDKGGLRHMDARYWWITDLQESGLIKVSFVPTKENLSDIGTKNVTGEVFDRIRPELMKERPESEQEGNQE